VSEQAGRLAAVFTCVWYELIYFAHKGTPEVLATYAVVGALACLVSTRSRRPILAGVLCGLTLVLRFQYMLALGVLAVVAWRSWSRRDLMIAVAAFLPVVVAAGLVDRLTWGRFFGSYYNYFVFNQTHQVSIMFGVRPFWYFLVTLGIGSLALLPAGAVLSLRRLRQTWLPLAAAAAIVGLHSIIPHKEYRFILGAIPLLLVVLGLVVALLVVERSRQPVAPVAMGAVMLLSLVGGLDRLPFQGKLYHQPIHSTQEILAAFKLLNTAPGVQAILNTYAPSHETGGQYYLHRNVPLYHGEQLELRNLTMKEPGRHVSHVVCKASDPPVPGFQTVKTIGGLDVRQQISPAALQPFGYDTSVMLFGGVDGKFASDVGQPR
jgi:phosphatidylinositol glycan class B